MMEKLPSRINWLQVLAYLLLEAGVAMLTTFIAIEGLGPGAAGPALALIFFFATSGVIAFTFYARERRKGWLALALLPWIAAAFMVLLWVTLSGWLHPALMMALLAFGAAGVSLYFAYRRKDAPARPMLSERTQFDPLGAHHAAQREATPIERDHS